MIKKESPGKPTTKGVGKFEPLLDAVVEDLLAASDEDIEGDVRARGEDPKQRANALRGAVGDLLLEVGKERMAAAKRAHLKRSAVADRYKNKPLDSLKKLIAKAFESPEAAELSLAYREGKYQSEDDLRSLADDLAELGLLPHDDE